MGTLRIKLPLGGPQRNQPGAVKSTFLIEAEKQNSPSQSASDVFTGKPKLNGFGYDSLGWQVPKNPELALEYAKQSATATDPRAFTACRRFSAPGESVSKPEAEGRALQSNQGVVASRDHSRTLTHFVPDHSWSGGFYTADFPVGNYSPAPSSRLGCSDN